MSENYMRGLKRNMMSHTKKGVRRRKNKVLMFEGANIPEGKGQLDFFADTKTPKCCVCGEPATVSIQGNLYYLQIAPGVNAPMADFKKYCRTHGEARL